MANKTTDTNKRDKHDDELKNFKKGRVNKPFEPTKPVSKAERALLAISRGEPILKAVTEKDTLLDKITKKPERNKVEKGNSVMPSFMNNKILDNEDTEEYLTVDQVLYMLSHHNEIEKAYRKEDIDTLTKLALSDEYKKKFGDMEWDEAYDLYETYNLKTQEAISADDKGGNEDSDEDGFNDYKNSDLNSLTPGQYFDLVLEGITTHLGELESKIVSIELQNQELVREISRLKSINATSANRLDNVVNLITNMSGMEQRIQTNILEAITEVVSEAINPQEDDLDIRVTNVRALTEEEQQRLSEIGQTAFEDEADLKRQDREKISSDTNSDTNGDNDIDVDKGDES